MKLLHFCRFILSPDISLAENTPIILYEIKKNVTKKIN